MATECDIAIVGAGLAGLACALHLQEAGIDAQVFEAADAPGGRVRTDRIDSFILDRGFQVLLEAYPECRRMLDYGELNLQRFEPGALIHLNGKVERVADPLRRPRHAVESLLSGIGTLGDKLRVLKLRRRALAGNFQSVFKRSETTALEALRQIGFSRGMIDSFFRPYLGGIFLGRDLETSSRMMDFVVRMMAKGNTSIPAEGIESIPRQLAARLRPGTLHLNQPAKKIEPGKITFSNRHTARARVVVVATDGTAASALSGGAIADPGARDVTCLYFAAPRTPVEGAWLVLDGDGKGPVNNLVVASQVSPSYAPHGTHLISATVLGDPGVSDIALVQAVRGQMFEWYGRAAKQWEFLRIYRIRHAQPMQGPGFCARRKAAEASAAEGVVYCGDYLETASLHGALIAGRRAAGQCRKLLSSNVI